MASHPDSPPTGPDDHPDSFQPGLGGAGTDARAEGEGTLPGIDDTPPPEDQPMPAEDQPMPGETPTHPPDSPGDYAGTAGTGGVDKVQEDLDR